ncbi:MAG: hypothetical protein M1839_004116 [Geoglossum umbratile]|nr:MAG: hypothetical protein M1839_004116 [Geoglossum umbratile]
MDALQAEAPHVAPSDAPETEQHGPEVPVSNAPEAIDAENGSPSEFEAKPDSFKEQAWSSRRCLGVVIVVLILAIAAVGGGVGGVYAHRNKASPTAAAATQAIITATPTTAPPTSTTIASIPQNTSYPLGCFYDDANLALRESRRSDPAMTPQLCAKMCTGYLFYGVENGNTCLCGKVLHDGYPRAQDSDCNSQCTGNSTIKCGGVWRLQVYTVSPFEKGPPPLNFTLKGCYEDQWERALPNFLRLDSRMTPALCAGFCQGYKFMGVEYSTQCMCGYAFSGNYPKVPDTDCNATCGGDESQNCGATWRLNLYLLG